MTRTLIWMTLTALAFLFVHWLVNQLWHEQPMTARDVAQALLATIVGSALARKLSAPEPRR